jgi:hypothetical protein
MARPAAARLTVVPVRAADEDPLLHRLSTELALRCPATRQVPLAEVQQFLPRFQAPMQDAAGADPDPRAAFQQGPDPLGSAARLNRMIAELEQDPVALLTVAGRRARLREAYLYAAQALLRAGDGGAAQSVLVRAAVRLPDLPGASAADWGSALSMVDQQARRRLPRATQTLTVEGPTGWAVHLDEVPLGALPRQTIQVRPGAHAVVAVGPDGTRVSWRLNLSERPGPSSPLHLPIHLIVDRHLSAEVCALEGQLALCPSAASAAASWTALSAMLDSELLLLRREGAQIEGRHLRPGEPLPPPILLPIDTPSGEPLATRLSARLCPPAPARANPPPVPRPAPAVSVIRQKRRVPAWPGAVLLGAGVAFGAAATPFFVLQGRCVDPDCALIYDFRAMPPGLVSVGGALVLGGALWLGLTLR